MRSCFSTQTITYMRVSPVSQGKNLLGVEKQELSVLLANVFNVHLGARGKCDVNAIAFSQLDGVTTDVDLDRSTSCRTSVVTGSLDEMSVDIGALGGVGEGSGRREDGSEDVEWSVDRGRATGLALIDDLLTVLDDRCDNMRPFVPLVFVGEMPKKRPKSGRCKCMPRCERLRGL